MIRRTDLWNVALDWTAQEDEYPDLIILGYSLKLLFLYHTYKELV